MAASSPGRVDFYLLSDPVPEGKLKFTCRLVQKIFTLGKTVFVLVDSEDAARRLDDLLWTLDQSSFVPHLRRGCADAAADAAPVVIDHEPPRESDSCNVLVSLRHRVPACAERFERVVELVDNRADDKRTARGRFRYYRDKGFAVETHEVSV